MSEEPEIILRLAFYIDGTEDDDVPKPMLLLLANRTALLQLSEFFARLADATVTPFMVKMHDADDHQHNVPQGPGEELSDDMEIRLGKLTPEHREAILEKYGLEPWKARRGSLTEQLSSLIEQVERRKEQEP